MAHPALTMILREVNKRIDARTLRVADLARELEVSRSCCYDWLSGARDPSWQAVVVFAKNVGWRLAVVK